MSSTTKTALRQFQATVWQYYRENGRHDLPWRKTTLPYRIVVSEMMLQQTQVDRVLPKYQAFLKAFPTVRRLAAAPQSDVLKLWQGLGYNRRAKYLHACAKTVTTEHSGKFPRTYRELQTLPGIGPYTAGAVMAFAYNEPVSLIETNVRTVFIHHFFKDQTNIEDKEIVRYIELTLDQNNPREWYWALMDYGAQLKKTIGNLNNKSKHYSKQSPFAGSDRQIRGAIIRALTANNYTDKAFHKLLSNFLDIRIDAQLEKLLEEGMIKRVKRSYTLAD